MPRFWRWAALLALLAAITGGLVWSLRPAPDTVETLNLPAPSTDAAPAMCPWRTPASDMAAFFPGADHWERRTWVLSGLRVPLKQRLGPRTPLESNVLYVYRVWQGLRLRGVVLVQRAAADYGAVEVVLGVGPDGRVAGARLQRQREPPAIARVVAGARWLGSFRGKTADDPWRVGADLPAVPAAARPAADTIAGTVRALLIERDVARRHGLS